MFEHAPPGVLHFDAQGLITARNDRFADIIGSARDKLVSLNMLELPEKNLLSAVEAALRGRPGYYEDLYSSVRSEKQTPVRDMFAPSADSKGKIVGGIRVESPNGSGSCFEVYFPALQEVAAEPNGFGLVFTDMTMPGMTGDVLASEMLKIRPDARIILCTD